MQQNDLSRKKRKAHALLAGALAVCFFSSPSFAGNSPDLEAAKQLLNEGRAAQSAALLRQDFATWAGNADYDFLLGTALYLSEQSGEALFAFERVLMAEPGHAAARLKVAQINLDRGNLADAAELLQPLSPQQLDDAQQRAYREIQTEIARRTDKRTFMARGYVSGGIAYDSNVTGGPARDQLILPKDMGPPGSVPVVTYLGSAQAEQDSAAMMELGGVMQKAVAESTWLIAEGNLHQGYNRKRTDVNDGYANLNLGVVTRFGKETLGGGILAQTYQVAHVTYRNSSGGRLNWTHSFGDTLALTSYIQQMTFTFPDHVIDNTVRRVAGAQLQAVAGHDSVWQGGIFGGNEAAQDVTKPQFSFHLKGFSLGGKWTFSPELSFSVATSFEARTHDARDPLYLKIREDALLLAGAALDYKFSRSGHLIPGYFYTRNTSNAELYDYARHAYWLQLKWEFDNEDH